MKPLLGLAMLVVVFASGPAMAQRVHVEPPMRVEPMPRIEPAPPIEPLSPTYTPPQDVYSMPPPPAYSVQQDSGDSGDSDSDGFSSSDCNDLNAAIHPGAYDGPGGQDMDCDGDPNG